MGKGRRSRENRRPRKGRRSPSERLEAFLVRSKVWFSGIGRRTRIVAVLLAVAVLGGLAWYLHGIPAEQPVEFELKADQGSTSFQLAAETDAVSPGCGCPEPELGEQHWQGMSIPSTGFDLNVEAEASDEVAERLWSLTVMAPNTGPMDWFGRPNHALWMWVDAVRPDGTHYTLFAGPADHLMIWSDRAVSVHQPRVHPYAAILPAYEGTTSFSSREASRAQWGARVDVASSSPDRPAADFDRNYWQDLSNTQRGPMVDLLGPTVRFSVPYTDRTKIWAASKALEGFRPGDRLIAAVSTPFALRLIPHPVQRDWQSAVVTSPPENLLNGVAAGAGDDPLKDPVGQKRVLLEQPLPGYEVRLSDVRAPDRDTWETFARHSSEHEMVTAMMGRTRLDPLESAVYKWDQYALPPVTDRPQIGVFGRISEFESTSVGGQAVIGSDSQAIPRGEKVEFSSDDGLTPGAYRLTPLVSSGQETTQATISGTAKVWIGGDLASHPDWLPWIPFSTLLGAILGVVLTEIYHRLLRETAAEEQEE